jgi:nucleotide-binding universal stress UspA family protein
VDENTALEPGVTVGVDGTVTALRAVGWATAEAGARGVPLHIVHAAPYAGDAEGRRRAETILAHARSTAHRCDGSVALRTELLDGQPVPALVQASEAAGLLVVGMADGRTGEVVLGSVAMAVTARARCPVTVVRGRHRVPTSGRPVLLGVDDVSADAAAVSAAFADAQRHRTPLVVLHARPGHASEVDTDVAAELEEQLAPWRRAHPEVRAEVRIVRGRPEDALLHAAAQARLVIVSSRRRGNLARIVLGSCSRALARHSPCPVCIVEGSLADPGVVTPGTVPAPAVDPHDVPQPT